MVTNNIKLQASTLPPSQKEIDYWVDLTEDPNGGVIKNWNGKTWESYVQKLVAAEAKARKIHDTEIIEIIDGITLTKTDDLEYTLYVHGKSAGVVSIPKDQFLSDVTYNNVSNILTLVFETTDGQKTQTIDFSDLAQDLNTTYTFTDGSNGTFTVSSSTGSTQVVSVGSSPVATTSNAGLLSAEDKAKLDSIEENANNYILPTASAVSDIETSGDVTVSDVASKINELLASLRSAGFISA